MRFSVEKENSTLFRKSTKYSRQITGTLYIKINKLWELGNLKNLIAAIQLSLNIRLNVIYL